MFSKNIIALGAMAMLAGCATAPKDIAPAYVSTGLYENLSCPQLRREAEGVSARAAAAFGKQEQNKGRDAAMTGVSLILFWPAAFFLKGDGADAAEVARLKGEMVAIDQVNRVKNCGIQFFASWLIVVALATTALPAQAIEQSRANPAIYHLQVAQVSCEPRKTCGKIRSCDEAVWYMQNCSWGGRLDGDSDGAPCENLCGSNN